jgi:TonB-linked SusC/RagA family outer membrane protein
MKKIIVSFILFNSLLYIIGQTSDNSIAVKGIVKDAETGDPLIGASIKVIHSLVGKLADANGYYAILIKTGKTQIEFSFLGYKSMSVDFYGYSDTIINGQLTKDTLRIEEVTVTKQRNFWGNMENGRNISSIGSKKIELINSNNAADILQASMPGIWSTNTSGAPGDHQKVRIRGVNTIFGCSDPLYIIDGVAVPIVNLHSLGISDLNTNDIETVTVLKDAASAALYGYQGGNGVVIVDTKQKMGKNISFSTKYGVQEVPRFYNLTGTRQFLTTLDSALLHKVVNQYVINSFPIYNDNLANTNWQKVLFKNGIVNEYQLSGSGNIGKTNFYLSGNYYTQGGIIANSSYQKYNLSGKVTRNFSNKLIFNVNFHGSVQNNKNNLDEYNGSNLIIEGINKSPCTKSTKDSLYYYYPKFGTPSLVNRNYYDYKLTMNNPNYGYSVQAYPMLNNQESLDSLINDITYKLLERTGTINIQAKYFITNDLFLNASSSISMKQRLYSVDIKHYVFSDYNNFMESNEHYLLLSQQLNLNYNKTFGNNNLSIVAGYRNYANNAYWNLDSIKDSYNAQQTWVSNSLVINNSNASVTREIQAIALHVNYDYKKKYFVSLLANYEQLNINQVSSMARLFPSIALTWDISQEKLLKKISWLNKFNVFVNYGQSGNYPINALSKDYYNTYYYYYFNDSVVNSKGIKQYANHYLKSEIVNEYNCGTNVSLLDNRVKLNFDYYNKTNDNLTIMRDIPISYGGGKALINIGKVTNSGKELDIEVEPIRLHNFSWVSHFMISTNIQRVKNIGGINKMEFANANDILIPQFEVAINAEVGVMKGYKYIGPWTGEDTKLKDKRFKKSLGSKYLAVDTTSSNLTNNDFATIGKTLPDYTWNWDNQFNYKNFSLDFLWYAVIGVNKYNATRASTYMSGLNSDVAQFVLKNDNSLIGSTIYQSSYFVEDASFIRLKRLTFSYQFPKKVFKYADMKLSLSFENFITITKYKGYDPEASIYTDNSFSDFGVDRGAYPNPKSVFFSININL